MTKATITKTAKENNINLTLIKISRCSGTYRFEMADLSADLIKKNLAYYYETGDQLPEVENIIKKYNREVKKLLKALGVKYWGLKTGSGEWDYKLGEQSYMTKLALANID